MSNGLNEYSSESRSVASCSNRSPGSGLDISTDCTVASKFQILGSSEIWLLLVTTRDLLQPPQMMAQPWPTPSLFIIFFIRVFVIRRVFDGGWSSLQTKVIMGIIDGGISRLLLVFSIWQVVKKIGGCNSRSSDGGWQ